MGGLDSGVVGRKQQEPVVGADERATVARSNRDSPAVPADIGIDDGEMHPDGQVRNRVAEDDRALEHRLGRDPVRDVDHPDLGSDPGDHAVAGADELVLQAEVGEECDHRHPWDSIRSRTAPTRPSRSCVAASTATVSPTERATREVSGPIVTAGASPPTPA